MNSMHSDYILMILLALIAFSIFWFGRIRRNDLKHLNGHHAEDVAAHKEITEHIDLMDGKVARLTVRIEVLEKRKDRE